MTLSKPTTHVPAGVDADAARVRMQVSEGVLQALTPHRAVVAVREVQLLFSTKVRQAGGGTCV